MPAMQSLLAQILNTNRLAQQKFYLVVVPSDASPHLLEFSSIEPLVATIIEQMGKEAWVFPFLGHHLSISRGKMRWLITPYGNVPLFAVPDPSALEIQSDGYIGPESVEISFPPVPVSAQNAETDDEADDETSPLPT